MAENAEGKPPEVKPPTAPARNADGFSVQAIHLVRTTQQINVTLSQMADAKASILMGATFVVFTISVGQASKGAVPYALLVLALSAFLSAFCAVMAVMPSFRPPPRNPGQENILFFGVFAEGSEQDYADRVLDQLRSDETVFRTMLRDSYQNGVVLHRKKYRFLGYAYRIFLTGLTLTLITFLIESHSSLLPFL
ncbi:Pycsar system effector family protein [Novosphingobium sp. G106]|uniref:Pycsar system effector family protein n=1 Tax=Novosphingobium sp. G106 TaxID=2849500 RepID=UPI0020C35AA2|nr:Pycsar system effector family protein [Novosphingobium sp. G106]